MMNTPERIVERIREERQLIAMIEEGVMRYLTCGHRVGALRTAATIAGAAVTAQEYRAVPAVRADAAGIQGRVSADRLLFSGRLR